MSVGDINLFANCQSLCFIFAVCPLFSTLCLLTLFTPEEQCYRRKY